MPAPGTAAPVLHDRRPARDHPPGSGATRSPRAPVTAPTTPEPAVRARPNLTRDIACGPPGPIC